MVILKIFQKLTSFLIDLKIYTHLVTIFLHLSKKSLTSKFTILVFKEEVHEHERVDRERGEEREGRIRIESRGVGG